MTAGPELSAADLDARLAAARALALEAGALLLERLGRAGPAEAKAGTEFVTEADREAEDLILRGLAARFPGESVLAEESGRSGAGDGPVWCIDPLDGTTNFAHSYAFFGVSVACTDASGPLAGAVCAPYLDELYLARRGGGAAWERPRLGGGGDLGRRGPVDLDRALLATGFPYVRDDLVDRNVRLVRDFLKAPCHGMRRGGSAAIDLCHVAAGRLDGYWEFKLRPWDTAAGALIAREAGCRVTDAAGRDEPVPTASVVAAAPGLHEQMLRILAAAEEDTP